MQEHLTATSTPSGTPDPHVGWWEEHQELERRWQAVAEQIDALPSGATAEIVALEKAREPLLEAQSALEDRIAETAASTLAGALVQLRVALIAAMNEAPPETGQQALEHAIPVIERLANCGAANTGT